MTLSIYALYFQSLYPLHEKTAMGIRRPTSQTQNIKIKKFQLLNKSYDLALDLRIAPGIGDKCNVEGKSDSVSKDEPQIIRIAQEIERYLVLHPAAADSLEGVAKWWLTQQRYQEALVTVKEALEYLIISGRVVETKKSDGTIIYRKQKT